MSFFLDTKETSQRFGNKMLEIDSLLDINHVSHGSPNDIFEFAKVLESSNQFRIELSTLVKSVVQKESEEILLTDMMSIIMTSVGGPSFAEMNVDITRPTNILMEFLLGTGCWRGFGLSSPSIAPVVDPSPRLPLRTDEPRFARLPSSGSAPGTSESHKDQPGLRESSSELRQMLARIEINTEEFKRHLDSIEQRIDKIESPQGTVAAQESSQADFLPHPSSADVFSGEITRPTTNDVSVSEAESSARTRAVFFSPAEQSEIDDLPSPTFAYAVEGGKNIASIGVFLALLTIAALSIFLVHSGAGRALLKASVSHFSSVRSLFSSAPATAPTSKPSPLPPAVTAQALPITPATPTKNANETTSADSRSNDGTRANISPDARTSLLNPKIRYVPANVMAGHLLSAPRPQYPPLARVKRIEGGVALQATISKTGTVETLHVIKGPQPLRSAAIDAVRQWRYRAFSINGRPSEVVTTVYVDFSLKPPPTTAH
jgi:TonB family protein